MKIIHNASYLKSGKIILLLLIIISQKNWSQQFTTNRNPVGMEHNLLFNATTRYLVTTTGPELSLGALFDGKMEACYSNVAPTDVAPKVILIENLPAMHTQAGAWVGWSTRYWPTNRFKIEGFETYNGANIWRTISDYSATDYNGSDYNVAIPFRGIYTKLRFTFYRATGVDGNLGISELFFIHPEATSPYQGLLASSINNWENNSSNLCYNTAGKVGIGTNSPDEKLTVKGKIHTQEVRVDMTGALVPDYVFANDYKLKSLLEIESYIKENNHLPEIPSAGEIEKNGLLLAEMNMSLLKKVEELTLYMIEMKKENQKMKEDILKLKQNK
jgi:hypothetical protein